MLLKKEIYKTGQVIMFNWKNWYSNLIRFYNHKYYGIKGWSHCGIIIEVSKNEVLIAEAIAKGFVITWYPKWFMDEKISENKITIGESKIPLRNIKKITYSYEGTPYSWVDAFGILLSLFGIIIKLTGAKKVICSEIVCRILYDASNKKLDFEKEFDKPFDRITPTDIFLSKQLKFLKGGI